MFGVESKAARQWWIENCDGEDGSSTESLRVGEVQRPRQRYESMREQSIVGGESTRNMGGRAYATSGWERHGILLRHDAFSMNRKHERREGSCFMTQI
jgi:hypothetical protein